MHWGLSENERALDEKEKESEREKEREEKRERESKGETWVSQMRELKAENLKLYIV